MRKSRLSIAVILAGLFAGTAGAEQLTFTAGSAFEFITAEFGASGITLESGQADQIVGGGSVCYDYCSMGISTGPLVDSNQNSWTFGAGTLFESGIGSITGNFIGSVTVTLTPDGGLDIFDVTGPIVFDIDPALAAANGLTTGPYVGTYSAEFLTLADSLVDGWPTGFGTLDQRFGGNDPPTFPLPDANPAPEPAAWCLLTTALFCLAIRRAWVGHHRSKVSLRS